MSIHDQEKMYYEALSIVNHLKDASNPYWFKYLENQKGYKSITRIQSTKEISEEYHMKLANIIRGILQDDPEYNYWVSGIYLLDIIKGIYLYEIMCIGESKS